jgi:hypothetical protein
MNDGILNFNPIKFKLIEFYNKKLRSIEIFVNIVKKN